MVRIHNKTTRVLAVVLRFLYASQLGLMFYWFTMDHLHWFRYSSKPDRNQEYQHMHPVISLNYHYMFMLMAYPIPFTEAFVTFRVWGNMYGFTEPFCRNLQSGLLVYGLILLVCGIIFIHTEKEANEDPYLYSPHGWTGVMTVVSSTVWTLWGLMLWVLGPKNRFARRSMPWFNSVGLISMMLGFHNIGSGLTQEQFFLQCDNNYCKENIYGDILCIQSQFIFMIAVFIGVSADRVEVVREAKQSPPEQSKNPLPVERAVMITKS
mmetsp:Transcript_18369/g.40150  ORF Transcript_18369/g.40150 Transcript_18369/m.40150 type:complete len:265 (-) Transcript_18369:634-1428(-)|eukprot:CAMPEP_0118938028 /NCGR_PEP_ID=MMETSP1169-20130426/24554_1 /TAXON_ID=36882 /ORGANISM="Pyramimonas obovata, Strain CCMP722" /LENGTH=264 /DNA_ID=CAMNT_0006881853 /DNA_START=181 /DNA_END=975 /DNA_ORIENTATION=-